MLVRRWWIYMWGGRRARSSSAAITSGWLETRPRAQNMQCCKGKQCVVLIRFLWGHHLLALVGANCRIVVVSGSLHISMWCHTAVSWAMRTTCKLVQFVSISFFSDCAMRYWLLFVRHLEVFVPTAHCFWMTGLRLLSRPNNLLDNFTPS